ncbi:MAG: intradiol ring-cleavage dioxygenase [Pseudolabrys sp.]|nr:intradiol ring-cleavage dioxygenase [Pseudolabrys sp.]
MQATRRSILAALLTAPPAFMLGTQAGAQELPLTPSCGDSPAATVAQTAGPFYTPNAPLKRDLFPDAPRGRRLTLAGFVVDRGCKPVKGALVEIWHADQEGAYDNKGHRLRGHQLTDEAGRWGFNTIVTAQYPGRTAHYHFRVQAPGGRPLITQLYFPDDPRNRTDRLFDARLVLKMAPNLARFDFVV